MRSKLKIAALTLVGLVTVGALATRLFFAPTPQPQSLVGPIVGVQVGPSVGVATGVSANPFGGGIPLILMFGDSQIPGEAATDAADPSSGVTVTQPTTYVYFDKHYAQAAADPPVYQTDLTGGVRPYSIGGTPGMGMEISIGQELTRLQQHSVLAVFGIAGMSCAQSLPASTYPTTPPNVWSQLVSRIHGLESSRGAQAKVALISLGNNDGANATDAGNLTTTSATLAAALRSNFPGITITWIRINADTVNAAGFAFEATAIANQNTFFTNDSAILSIYNDDRALQSDHAHFTADTALTVGQRFMRLAMPSLGLTEPRPTTYPAVVGWGPQMFGTGNTSPASWGRAQAGDLEVLVVVSLTASGVNNALTTPAGWTLIGTTTSASGGATTRAGFYRRAVDSTMITNNHSFTAPTTVTAANSNEFSEIITIRGPNATAPTVEASQLSVNNAFGTSLTDTGVTTLGSNRTIVMITAGFRTNATANTVSITDATLSNITVIKNGTRDSGLSNFATIDVQTGTLAAAGSTGNPSVTMAQNTIAVGAVLAIAP